VFKFRCDFKEEKKKLIQKEHLREQLKFAEMHYYAKESLVKKANPNQSQNNQKLSPILKKYLRIFKRWRREIMTPNSVFDKPGLNVSDCLGSSMSRLQKTLVKSSTTILNPVRYP
jgi:hypothetical protein